MAIIINVMTLTLLLATVSYAASTLTEVQTHPLGHNDVESNKGMSCIEQLEELMACMDVVQSPDFPPAPSDLCCFAVQTVNATCVCKALSKLLPDDLSSLNIQAALVLPRICDVYVPPNTTCAGYTLPQNPNR